MTILPRPLALRSSPIELLRSADAVLRPKAFRDRARYVAVRPGVYAPRERWEDLAPWERYLARVHAYAQTNPAAVFAFESAAALYGLPLFGEPRSVHVFDEDRSRSRRFGDVVVHTSADQRDIRHVDGFHITAPAETAVDLMRVLPAPFALAVGDTVIAPRQVGLVSLAELIALADVQINRRGIRQVRLLLETVDPRAESVGESIGRAVILWSGFERPELQVEFRTGGITDRVDFAWRSVRAIAESDGYGKYRAETADDAVRAIILEKQREDRLRRHCDTFGRWDMRAAIAIDPVVAELRRLGVPRVTAPRWALLAAMRSNPRSLQGRGPLAEKPDFRRNPPSARGVSA